MRYSAMPMRVPLFHSLAELMATMMRYYCHGEVPEAMLPALAASNGLASFVQLGASISPVRRMLFVPSSTLTTQEWLFPLSLLPCKGQCALKRNPCHCHASPRTQG